MNTKTSTPSLKYHYKTSSTPTASHTLNLSHSKESRPRTRKDSRITQPHHRPRQSQCLRQWRDPLGQLNHSSPSNLLNLDQFHRKEGQVLRKRNEQLQRRIEAQVRDMNQLKKQMEQVKHIVGSNIQNTKGGASSKHRPPQQGQSRKKTVSEIRNYRPQQQPQAAYSTHMALVEHQVSRRQQYLQQYQVQINSSTPIKVICPNCSSKESATQELRQKYSDQLRSLQEQVGELKEKGLMVQVLEKQVQNKNQCIDYLQHQLQMVEGDSRQLLTIIKGLQQRMQGHPSGIWMGRESDSFQTFSNSKY